MAVRTPSRRAMTFTAEGDRVDDARRRLLADWCRLVGRRLGETTDAAGESAATSEPRQTLKPNGVTIRPAAAAVAPLASETAGPSAARPPAARTSAVGPAAAIAALGLPPRMAQILAGLLAGGSEKQIAAGLAISPHTVHTHVKLLHKRMNVSSRGELLARFIDAP